MTAALRAQPGTRHEVAVYQGQVKTPGIAQSVGAQAFGGGASWIGYGIITGHWYDAPGQVDVNTAFLTQSGLAVGDSATVTIGTNPVTVRIAGEVFQPSGQPMVFGSTQTLPGLATTVNLQEYYVGLRPGTSAAAYIQAVNARLGSRSPWAATGPQGGQFYQIGSALIGLLALMVAIAAGLGVLNTVLMTSRDRVHDLGYPGQLHSGVPAEPARAAVPGRAGHRGRRGAAAGRLGGPGQTGHRAARRVTKPS
ncbi:MAG TPA: hypothetical protein VHO07_27885 [Streptosporangiaceae bacterium]|nr:hypothetical protein [Streptosporangiaceae bacterium]